MFRFARLATYAFAACTLVALMLAAAGPVDAAEKYTRGLRYPSLTPDGKQVVFGYRGDIWVTDVDGKSPARRLTIHEAQDTLPRVSPDGKSVIFSSQREGGYDLFVIPITGGEAKRLSFHSGIEIMCDFSPDGKHVLFASNRDPSLYRIDLYEMPATGGAARRVTRDGGRDGAYSQDGKTIVYARGFNTIYQDNYAGSANYDLYTIARAGGTPKRLLKTKGNERHPFFSKDGKEIWFVAEEKGVANFYAIPAAGGKRRKVTSFTGNDVHRPDLSWDGVTAVYERWGRLYTTDLTDKTPTATELPLVVKGDRRHSGLEKRTVTTGAEQVHLSKDGSRMVFSLHGDIWQTAGSGGTAKRLTSGTYVDEWPRFSPDGKRIAFQSDRSGNSDIWMLEIKTGGITQVTKDKAGDFFHNWSPDGSKLVFCSERSGNRDIWTIDVESKETAQITKDKAGDDDPTYSPDGRSIAFDSAREGNQAIYIMDADGKNVRRVTGGGGFLQVPCFSPDGTLLAYEVFNPANGRSGGLYVVSTAGGAAQQISRNGQTACWSPRGDYVYFSVGARGRQEIFRVPAPKSVENREKVPFIGSVEVDLRKELADLFDEAWRALGRGFYDAKMHGVDWNKMRAKYRDMAIDAENKAEFQNFVRQMLAELNASHLGISGGSRPSNSVRARTVATGYLGVDLADGAGPSGGRKITSVFSKGPADQAGLRVGDEIIALNGKAVKGDTDLDRVLGGTVGKEISVRFRPITEDGPGSARNEKVKPISSGALRQMQYRRWGSGNARRVMKETKGRVGYIHLNAMNQKNLANFQRTVANWTRRKRIKGMILDVRENGGGNIHQQLMQILTARPFARVSMRGSPMKVTQPALYWDKPVVVLINERSFSDAEVFPYVFQQRKIGKVIGVPTPGGVIGTNDITLSDGTTFRIPRTRYEGMDGTNLEGFGVKPDILVEHTAEDRLKGRDRQLAKAIKVVLAEIQGGAKPTPTPPKPTPKPTPKPGPAAPKPTEEGTPRPPKGPDGAAKRTAGAMDPLLDAKAGEWVRYTAQLPGGTEKTTMKVSVTNVADGTVHFDRELESGPPLPLPLPDATAQAPLLDALSTMGKVVSQQTQTADVKGERVEVAIVVIEAFGGTLRMTFSNAVPCMGLVKVELGKVTLLEAVEWGVEKPAAEEPSPSKVVPSKQPEPKQPEPKQPEPKPAPKPAPEKPSAEADPVPGPAAKAPKGPRGPINPLYDAKVGEWVRMRSLVQGEETIATLRVVEVTEDSVKLESRIAYGGKEIKGAVLTRPRRERLALGGRGGRAKVQIGKETVEVKGKQLECVTIERTSRRGVVDKRWYCREVAVGGLVRHVRSGKVVKELLDWGTGEPPALPMNR